MVGLQECALVVKLSIRDQHVCSCCRESAMQSCTASVAKTWSAEATSSTHASAAAACVASDAVPFDGIA